MHKFFFPVSILMFFTLSACAPMGAPTVTRDRMDYTTAVAESWKDQMLLNIVKIRYGDAPVFLDVASIVNQYALETELNTNFGWSFPPTGNEQSFGGSSSYSDRPTISYNLMTGEKFARSLMSPIPPVSVMALIESGYPINLVFRLLVNSINGIRNQFGGVSRMRRADPQFYPLLENLKTVQDAGAFSLRVRKQKDGEALVMFFRKTPAAEFDVNIQSVKNILGVRNDTNQFHIIYGTTPTSDNEVTLLTRSILEILTDISSLVEVPPEHVEEKRVVPTMATEGEGVRPPLIHIRYAKKRPEDAFVAVPYRGIWFWIDDREYTSKKLFSFLMFVMTLTEAGEEGGAPIVTISAGG